MAAAALILGELGAVLGGAVGSTSHAERWVDVALPLALAASRGRTLGITMAIPNRGPHSCRTLELPC
jgi:hypothetical protein